MLEYVFFDERPWARFADFARGQGLQPECSCGEDSLLVSLPEDTDDTVCDRLEAFYEQMMEMDEQIVAKLEGEGHQHSAGVTVSLGDGRSVLAAVDPGVLARVMTVLTSQEVGELVNAIVDAVEHPDERPMCKR